jgi:hypothetical protein
MLFPSRHRNPLLASTIIGYSRQLLTTTVQYVVSYRAHSLVNHDLDKSTYQNPTNYENAIDGRFSSILSLTSHKMSSHIFSSFKSQSLLR